MGRVRQRPRVALTKCRYMWRKEQTKVLVWKKSVCHWMIKMQIKRMVIGLFRVVCITAWIKAILKEKPAWQAVKIDRRKQEPPGARKNGSQASQRRARGSQACLLRASVPSACYAGYKSVTRNPGLYESVFNHLNFPLEISLRKSLGWIHWRHTCIAVAFDR